MQIKCINGYRDYDLSDDRFPKMICSDHCFAIHERLKNPSKISYKYKLPSAIPPYKEIVLPHAATRATPSGYSTDHTCFLCEQNTVGRPKNTQ